jgi:hypothetical protein
VIERASDLLLSPTARTSAVPRRRFRPPWTIEEMARAVLGGVTFDRTGCYGVCAAFRASAETMTWP